MKFTGLKTATPAFRTVGQMFVVDLCKTVGREGRTTIDEALFRAGAASPNVAALEAADASGMSEEPGSPVLSESSFSSTKSTDMWGGSSGADVSRMMAFQNVP